MTPFAKKMNERQAAGLCRACGRPQAPNCALCPQHRAAANARRRKKYADRKAARLCVEHGCPNRPGRGHVRCTACHAHFLALNLDWQREHRCTAPPDAQA